MTSLPPQIIIIIFLSVWILLICCIEPLEENKKLIRFLSFSVSIVILIIFLDMLYFFDRSYAGYQWCFDLPIIPEYGLNLSLGVDGISLPFLLLTAFIMPVCLYAVNYSTKNYKEYIVCLLLVELFLILAFLVKNIFVFYIAFESILIPMFLLIGFWGKRIRKTNAAYYFVLYTVAGAFFLVLALLYLFKITGSFDYEVIQNIIIEPQDQIILFILFFIPFAVKSPMLPFHLWLPEAHVEAPTTGSIVLASLLLKLGGYGFLRFIIPIVPKGMEYFSVSICVLAAVGILYASLATTRQNDLKKFVAYSSIAHMNLVILGVFSINDPGENGAVYLMVSHGITSGALFFLVGILYDRHSTRAIKDYGGLAQMTPFLATYTLLFNLANMGFPGTPNFIGEFLIFNGLIGKNAFVMFISTIGIVFGAIYSIWTFNRIFFGTPKKEDETAKSYADLNRLEYGIAITLLIVLVVLGLNSTFILDLTDLPIKKIIAAAISKK